MSSHHRLLVLFFLFIVITQVTAKYPPISSYSSLDVLKSLTSSKRSPLIVLIDPKKSEPQQYPDTEFDEFYSGDGGVRGSGSTADDEISDQDAKEEAKDMLFQYLRSSPEDSKSEKKKKHVLREALRQRCMTVNVCVTECPRPKKKPNTCPKKCQQKYDEEDLCGPSRPKRGRTMPPSWLVL